MALSDKRNLPPGQRDLLRAREYKVDLDSRLNKTSVVTANDNRDGAGYYCEVCDCVIKDSMNFLDHINGKNPNYQIKWYNIVTFIQLNLQ